MICDNRNALCRFACSVVLHTYSQKYAVRSGYQARCRVFTECIYCLCLCHELNVFAVYAELVSETAKPSGVHNE